MRGKRSATNVPAGDSECVRSSHAKCLGSNGAAQWSKASQVTLGARVLDCLKCKRGGLVALPGACKVLLSRPHSQHHDSMAAVASTRGDEADDACRGLKRRPRVPRTRANVNLEVILPAARPPNQNLRRKISRSPFIKPSAPRTDFQR